MTENGIAKQRTSRELKEMEWIEKQIDVVDLFLQGNTNYTALARKTNLDRATVVEMIEDAKNSWRTMESFKTIWRERLHEMDRHYSMLIKEGWETVENLKEAGHWDKVSTALKTIADIEGRRQDALHKAGIYDDSELGDAIAEMEEKTDAIKQLLKQVVQEYPETKKMIVDGIRRLDGDLPDPIVVDGDEN